MRIVLYTVTVGSAFSSKYCLHVWIYILTFHGDLSPSYMSDVYQRSIATLAHTVALSACVSCLDACKNALTRDRIRIVNSDNST